MGRATRRRTDVMLVSLACLVALESGCSSSTERVELMHTLGRDTWEVAICRIPAEHDSALYADGALTYLGTAQQIVTSLEAVTQYFSRWSMGRYRIEFEAAERDVEPTYGDPETCLDGALAQSRSESDGVLVVADLQHREGRNGGSGTWGAECTGNCPARRTRRSVYLGASDFVGLDGARVRVDLVEHEIGHALGWPHSTRRSEYDNVVDLMSDSDAPYRSDAATIDGPGVLAFNRYVSGWLDREPLIVDPTRGDPIDIAVDDLALVAVSDTAMLSIEFIEAVGDYSFLDSSGIAVHLIEWDDIGCVPPSRIVPMCARLPRRQSIESPLDSADGLMRAGRTVTVQGMKVVVNDVSFESARVTVTAEP